MSIQHTLNDDAISMFPKLKDVILSEHTHSSDNYQTYILRQIMNSDKAAIDMTAEDRELFSSDVIEAIGYMEEDASY